MGESKPITEAAARLIVEQAGSRLWKDRMLPDLLGKVRELGAEPGFSGYVEGLERNTRGILPLRQEPGTESVRVLESKFLQRELDRMVDALGAEKGALFQSKLKSWVDDHAAVIDLESERPSPAIWHEPERPLLIYVDDPTQPTGKQLFYFHGVGTPDFEDFANSVRSDTTAVLPQILTLGRDRMAVGEPDSSPTDTVEVSVYTSETDSGPRVVRAVEEYLDRLGLKVVHHEPPVHGSFFQRLWVGLKTALYSKTTGDTVARVERALESQYIDKPQSEADANHAAAVAKLMDSVRGEPGNVVVFVGALIVTKINGDVQAYTLTPLELAAMRKYRVSPEGGPRHFFAQLDRAIASENGTRVVEPDPRFAPLAAPPDPRLRRDLSG